MLQLVRGPGVLDPDIAAFAADQDQTFDRAFHTRPVAEQRALYEAFWRRYHAPRPPGIATTARPAAYIPASAARDSADRAFVDFARAMAELLHG